MAKDGYELFFQENGAQEINELLTEINECLTDEYVVKVGRIKSLNDSLF